ncbi:MAG TPA: hypothetical protein PLS49_06930, partial [Candidatus Woesebacteria bacterium]|nr:hypothetical protein [Candidatus Woesebacteria bacterium]
MKESPEQQQAIKMMLTLAILAAIGLLLAACGSTGSGTTVLRSPVEFVNGIPISNSSRSGVDVQGFSSFLATNIGKIQSYGCQSPTENNPIILVDGIHTDRASVVGDSRVIHLPPGEVIDIEVLVHEFKHAFCSEPNLQFEPVTNDWSITEFVSGTGRNIKLTGQSGLYLQVEVDGEEDFLMGLEEMSASSFLRREIAQYKNEREGVQSGYGSQPRG